MKGLFVILGIDFYEFKLKTYHRLAISPPDLEIVQFLNISQAMSQNVT